MLPERLPKKKRGRKTRQREIALPLNVFLCFLGPTWSPNGLKMMPNTCQEALRNGVGKMTEKSSQNERKIAPKVLPKWLPKRGPKNNPKMIPKMLPKGSPK